MPKTIIILPTYNEIDNLPKITSALLDLGIDNLHIMVIDDNSPDGTGKLADQLAEQSSGQISVMHRAGKEGLGSAYIAGFKHAIQSNFDYIVQMDADLSHQPKYILEMLKEIETHDLVIGSRYIPGGNVDEDWPIYRKWLSGFANQFYIRAILNFPVRDATAGFRLWRKETLMGIDLDEIDSSGYAFQIEMAYVAYRLGYHIKEIPIYFPERQSGESKITFSIQLEGATRVWQMRSHYRDLKSNKK